MLLSIVLALTSAISTVYALPARTERAEADKYITFEHAATGAKVQYVNNSGICETTPGVNQYSGYLSVGNNMNMFFWFFEARNNPKTAPLATWFNGGPGCSSMIGLFQENGPCHFENGASEPSLNPNSFNNYANMLYIDQPIGVGFSYGDDQVSSMHNFHSTKIETSESLLNLMVDIMVSLKGPFNEYTDCQQGRHLQATFRNKTLLSPRAQ